MGRGERTVIHMIALPVHSSPSADTPAADLMGGGRRGGEGGRRAGGGGEGGRRVGGGGRGRGGEGVFGVEEERGRGEGGRRAAGGRGGGRGGENFFVGEGEGGLGVRRGGGARLGGAGWDAVGWGGEGRGGLGGWGGGPPLSLPLGGGAFPSGAGILAPERMQQPSQKYV